MTKFTVKTPDSINDMHAKMVFEQIKKEVSQDLPGQNVEFELLTGQKEYDIILSENSLPENIALMKFNLNVDGLDQYQVQERVASVLYGIKKLNLTDKNYVYVFKPDFNNNFECMNIPDFDISSHNECISNIMRKISNDEIVYVDEVHEYIVENNLLVFSKIKETENGAKISEIYLKLDMDAEPSKKVDVDPRISTEELLDLIKLLHNEVKNKK